MARIGLKQGVLAAVAGVLVASAAQAGGLERSGYNIDLLFDPSDYAAEATATYVNPQRKLKNVEDTDTANTDILGGTFGGGNLNYRPSTADDTESYWAPRIGVKAALGDSIDCMADYSQPWGAHTNPGKNWAGANNNIETKVESDNYAATCSYKWEMGPGYFRVIGGGFYQEVGGFKERLVQDYTFAPFPLSTFSGVGRLELEDSGWGWRTGVAYEIPEYAMRASLVYNSAVDLDDLSGFIDLRQLAFPNPFPVGPPLITGTKYDVRGSASMPDSLELKVQSGIAPGWLAFGSIKWTDWSQLQVVTFCPATISPTTPCTSLDLLYRDGWTVTGGIGHKFNDQWSGAVSLTWDRGTSQGYGAQTDTWTLGTGVSYTPTENVEIRLAGVVGILTSGSSGPVDFEGETIGGDVSYDFDNDFVGAISTSLKVRF
ncbi:MULTISPECIES: OmpP1/FadL family transporter [Sinorhizobium]|uniref:OmpP1/FadL family transporter n=1 Tax=unclassified Sinorhizobium TaxID=2613772 RepID=UPI0023D817CC|nr:MULTISPECIES: OmpP1/FadL family transporter [unclassified Sinorhizobium]WEJ11412.1 OmpP1/FadL family transporter [Sinorhizobium sp. M103]WEJ16869.1 OmpP1/FadL family transporter [Sinorhizobium sp. K101]WEJ38401.1 OmpP1/FadL family transporter [Sinorhizobium sp. C101]